jgi:hypothetical protein
MTFDDAEAGAFSSSTTSAGRIISSRINVSTDWITRYGTSNLNSYSLQTYVHEIGHALGLGHSGDYNSEANYLSDAKYLNDSWATSIMSYFDQRENTWFADQGFTRSYVLSPMLADIVAMSKLYGLSTTTRVGDTTYGFNSTAGQAIFDARQYASAAYTIIDSKGTDTLDFSGYANNQLINLEQGSYSNVGSKIGNVAIAIGTVIENATGGSGNDRIFGNSANNLLIGGPGNDVLFGAGGDDILTGGPGADTLTGGDGADLFRDTLAGLNGDTIIDFSTFDRLVFTDAVMSSFSVSLSGSVLSYTGGSLTLLGSFSGAPSVFGAAGGGAEVQFASAAAVQQPARVLDDVRNDFNGDGRADLLWRNANGNVIEWLGQPNGTFANNLAATYLLGNAYDIIGTGDYNGDGRSDVLWRSNDNGNVFQWLGQSNGAFANNLVAVYQLSTDWQIASNGDFNGDGRSDVLWRNATTGAVIEWLGQTNGAFAYNAAATAVMPVNWSLLAAGDFNGDGRSDLIWRDEVGNVVEWLGQADGRLVPNNAASTTQALSWTPVGNGDYNGDSRDDLLWRDTASGRMTLWLGQNNGSFAIAQTMSLLGPEWQVEATNDFNGDGRADLIWRNGNTGAAVGWLGQADGGFVNNALANYLLDLSWRAQPFDLY